MCLHVMLKQVPLLSMIIFSTARFALPVRFFFLLARKEKRSATHVQWLLKTDNSLQKECLWHTQEKRNPQVSELCATSLLEFIYGTLCHTSRRLVVAFYPLSWCDSQNPSAGFFYVIYPVNVCFIWLQRTV